MRFKSKVVIITGGGTGLGAATAIEFVREGASVVVAGPDKKPLENIVDEIKNEKGEAIYQTTDVTKSYEVDELVKKAVTAYGKLDVMINNAGVNLAKPLMETTDEEVEATYAVNAKGTFYGMRSAITQIKNQGKGGSVINISSMSGLMGHATRTVYCGTKAAIINMTRCAAIEFGEDNIRINVICPGVMNTDMVKEHMEKDPTAVQGYIQSIPAKRMAEPGEIAKVILFLASDDASYVTGAVLAADGGFVAGK